MIFVWVVIRGVISSVYLVRSFICVFCGNNGFENLKI